MATSTNAFFLLRGLGAKAGGTGLVPVADGIFAPEVEPSILWGQGTPAGTLAPWTLVNKGSFHLQVDATDDQSPVWVKVDEGNDAADWVKLLTTPFNAAQTYVDTELHAFEINQTATMASGGNMVALNVVQTLAGTAGYWGAALYAKVVQDATKRVNGYITAGEFELTSDLAAGASHMFVITLNASKKNSGNASAFIALRDYGTSDMEQVFSFFDETSTTIASTSATLITAHGDLTATHLVRCVYGSSGTPIWLLASVNGA